jgi:hypothetical protein
VALGISEHSLLEKDALRVKICRKCQVGKPLDSYYAYKNTKKIYSACKQCCGGCNRAWREANPDRVREHNQRRGTQWTPEARAKYAITEREKHDSYLWRHYGITLKQYEKMLADQGGVCAICKQECNRQNSKRLCVDHDHGTGVVRGLLCFQCNVGIGKFKESLDILRKAVRYMESHQLKSKAA